MHDSDGEGGGTEWITNLSSQIWVKATPTYFSDGKTGGSSQSIPNILQILSCLDQHNCTLWGFTGFQALWRTAVSKAFPFHF